MFGERIKQRRKTLGYTQTDLGRLAGVTKAAVSFWEVSNTIPNGSNMQALAKALKCSPDWLLSGKGSIDEIAPTSIPIPLIELSQISQYLAGDFQPTRHGGHQSALLREAIAASEKTFALEWQGEGMRPRIERGDTVYIDPAQNDCASDGVYLFALGGKKPSYELGTLQETPRGLMLHFDNPAPGWEALPVKPAQCVGKVVAFIPKWLS